ncbi:GNAT family N-acetyltransferase, partial [Okeania sp. SIO2G5]|uniref:GNAT family N-acetyltransferase n=1 Tax=Okeania sp. SIO2G5 TaxID=2607796 RepID=UPI0013C23321
MDQVLAVSQSITKPNEPALSPLEINGAAVTVRQADMSDARSVFDLYTRVAHEEPGHLSLEENEVTLDYIHHELQNGSHRGLVMVLEMDACIIGYLNAWTSETCCSSHVLTQTTMMIEPACQDHGLGGMLLEAYLQELQSNMPHIYRFELFPHQSNQRAIEFYESHGFVREGEAVAKIRTANGSFESEVNLVWFNPNFSEKHLKEYQAELD